MSIETPSLLDSHNRQKEVNFHNLYAIEWIVGHFYMLIWILGIFARPLLRLFRHNGIISLSYYFPSPSYLGYFLIPMLAFIDEKTIGVLLWSNWAEPMELFLYSGIVLWLVFGIGASSQNFGTVNSIV